MSNPLFTLVQYLDVSEPPVPPPPPVVPDSFAQPAPVLPVVSEEQTQARIDEACRHERETTEQRLSQEYEKARSALQHTVATTLKEFAEQRSAYFARAESEVVNLALAIARKILGREAQLDPLLLAGLVRVALDGMVSEPAVTLRVAPAQLSFWQQHTVTLAPYHVLTLCPEPSLSPDECIIESSSGTARLSYEIQLKEVERGFLDLLGLRPDRPVPLGPSAEPQLA